MISVVFQLFLQDLVQESLQNKKNNNITSNPKTDEKHICLYLSSLNLLRAALHHTPKVLNWLSLPSASPLRWPSPGRENNSSLLSDQTPAMQSPTSYSATQKLESHFRLGSKPPTNYPVLSDHTVSFHWAPPLSMCVWETF